MHLITGNQHKFREFSQVIPGLVMLSIEIPEIQGMDQKKILEAKLKSAMEGREGEFLVEDTGLYVESLGGLPGPLVKWFMESAGRDGLVEMAEKMGGTSAKAITMIGYSDGEAMEFFEGVTEGNLVRQRKDSEFDWDAIFQPDSHGKTYAEMTLEEKNECSQRGKALRKLKEFLD